MLVKNLKYFFQSGFFVALLFCLACSKNNKDPYVELKVEVSLIDKNGDPVTTLAKDQATEVFVAVNKLDQSQSSLVEVAMVNTACVALSSTTLNLSSVVGIQFTHSEPLVLSPLDTCQEGENALIVFEVRDPALADQVFSRLVNLKIEASSQIPQAKVSNFYLNGATHSSLYPTQEFTFSFRLDNTGQVNIRELQVEVEPLGPLESLDVQQVGQNQKINVGESDVFNYEGSLKIMPYLGEANAVAFIIRWQANKSYNGEETITIPIVSPFSISDVDAISLIKMIPKDLTEIPEEDPDAEEPPPPPTEKYEWVEVGFTLKNETDFPFGPGEINIIKVERGTVEGYYGQTLFGEMPAGQPYKVARGSLRIKPTNNAKIITLKLEFKNHTGFRETRDLVLRKSEGNIWEVQ